MRSEFSSVASTGWIPKNQTQSTPVRHQSSQLHQSNSHHILPPSSPLLTPRARTASTNNKASSFAASVRSVFHRSPHRATSAASLHSAYSASSSSVKPPSYTSNADTNSLHPYASMVAAPLPVVSSHDASDEENECPVCLEPLSSSFRLPGEKPHIVPECGHSLHEVSTVSCRAPCTRDPLSSAFFPSTSFPDTPYRRGSVYTLQRRTSSHVPRLRPPRSCSASSATRCWIVHSANRSHAHDRGPLGARRGEGRGAAETRMSRPLALNAAPGCTATGLASTLSPVVDVTLAALEVEPAPAILP